MDNYELNNELITSSLYVGPSISMHKQDIQSINLLHKSWKFLTTKENWPQRPLEPRRSNLTSDLESMAQTSYATIFVWTV